jgi:hypothetical protein
MPHIYIQIYLIAQLIIDDLFFFIFRISGVQGPYFERRNENIIELYYILISSLAPKYFY